MVRFVIESVATATMKRQAREETAGNGGSGLQTDLPNEDPILITPPRLRVAHHPGQDYSHSIVAGGLVDTS